MSTVEVDHPPGSIAPLARCPFEVDDPIMEHRWANLTFLHWSYPTDAVQALLPRGLVVEPFEGRAWVGLVPFEMTITLPERDPVPWVSRFPETNVRTYVRATDGTTGIWFLSLDASRLGAVVVARTTYRLPYFWSDMSIEQLGPRITYRSERRWPGPRRARSEVVVDVGAPFPTHELDDLDHWLTARWRLYSARPRRMRYALAHHDPWPLHRATVVHVDDELFGAAGLPRPVGDPRVHWSPGVDVRVGAPEWVTPIS